MKWWQTGYWSLWRNETALHSPQSELDQGFLELQIVNDKSCATKKSVEGGSGVVLASMLYNCGTVNLDDSECIMRCLFFEPIFITW
jgi:hypothetical protein